METIEELKEQLEKLQEQLKQQEKLASLGLLSAGIVHEIRNPLNFVVRPYDALIEFFDSELINDR